MTTWTDWKLSEPGLKRLAQLASPRPRDHDHGIAMYALERRGLVRTLSDLPRYADDLTLEGGCCEITETGRAALAQARREGW